MKLIFMLLACSALAQPIQRNDFTTNTWLTCPLDSFRITQAAFPEVLGQYTWLGLNWVNPSNNPVIGYSNANGVVALLSYSQDFASNYWTLAGFTPTNSTQPYVLPSMGYCSWSNFPTGWVIQTNVTWLSSMSNSITITIGEEGFLGTYAWQDDADGNGNFGFLQNSEAGNYLIVADANYNLTNDQLGAKYTWHMPLNASTGDGVYGVEQLDDALITLDDGNGNQLVGHFTGTAKSIPVGTLSANSYAYGDYTPRGPTNNPPVQVGWQQATNGYFTPLFR